MATKGPQDLVLDVAIRHGGNDCATGHSSRNGWAHVPPTSGADCARVLRRAGFDVMLDGPDHIVAKRFGVPVVRVPIVDRLRLELLIAIARTAGLSAPQFIAYLLG